MSYIVTYEDDGVKPYLRATADDGIHGKHNVLFPKNGLMPGIPSRYDKNNVGVQIEVRDLAWKQTGKNGYYGVSPSDIVGVANVKAPVQLLQSQLAQLLGNDVNNSSLDPRKMPQQHYAKDLDLGLVVRLDGVENFNSKSDYAVVCEKNGIKIFTCSRGSFEELWCTLKKETLFVKCDVEAPNFEGLWINMRVVDGIVLKILPEMTIIITEYNTKTNLPQVSTDELNIKDLEIDLRSTETKQEEPPKKEYLRFDMNRFKRFKSLTQELLEALNLDESLFILR